MMREHLTIERIIACHPSVAWAMIARFGAVAEWIPGIEVLHCEGEDVGSRRVVRAGTGREFVERLVARDAAARQLAYKLIEGPLPLQCYVSTLVVTPASNGCMVRWMADYVPADHADPGRVSRMLRSTYERGLESLEARLRCDGQTSIAAIN